MENREVSVQNVRVRDGFWSPQIKNAVEKVIPYQWRVLNDREPGAALSRAMKNFRVAAGMEEGEFYGFQFQDSDVAKWIEAASYSLLYSKNPQVEEALREAVEVISKAQQPDGYLDTHYILKKPDKKWKEIAHGHELYCSGHMLEAAVAYYQATGRDGLLRVMKKNVKLIQSVFGKGPGKVDSYPGHEEIELALMKAYRVTGDRDYFELANYFVENRGSRPGFLEEEGFLRIDKDPCYGPDYHQAHAPIREQKTAEGHAVRAMYFYTGAADVALETGDPSLLQALKVLWKNVTTRRMYLTGGIGSQGEGERFTIDYDLPNDTCYTETCASIGLAMWALRMLRLEPDARYADVMERALYNNVLSGISQDGTHYFYVNPLMVKPDVAKYRQDHRSVETQRVKWFGCACCPPNVIRTLCGLGGYVYTRREDRIYQHLYLGNEAEFDFSTGKGRLTCTSEMPWEGKAVIRYEGDVKMELCLRIPTYAESFIVLQNGAPVCGKAENGYFPLVLKNGDELSVSFTMKPQFIRANPRVTEDCGRMAVIRGPLVYCAEEVDNGSLLQDFTLDPSLPPVAEESPLFGGIRVLRVRGSRSRLEDWEDGELYKPSDSVSREPAQLGLIPYFLWNNRGEGEMTVWMNSL